MNIVITGGTRGIGRGMAAGFLARGHHVAIAGRDQQTVDRAVAELARADGTYLREAVNISEQK